jgi:transmembrane sensor
MNPNERRCRASEEAATWWVRLEADGLAREEREQFVDWLRESQMHVAEMLRIAKVHDALERFQSWAQITTDGPSGEDNVIPLKEGPPPPIKRIGPRLRWVGAIAAAVGAIAAIAVLISNLPHGQIIDTDRGERREVALSDGSVLEVDPETRIRVAFEPSRRRVILEQGRALFRVAKNAERPFLVQADGTTVRAVGTAFGVERQRQSVIVTVAEGKVGVYRTVAPAAVRDGSGASGRERGASDAGTRGTAREPERARGGGTAVTPDEAKPLALTEILLTAGQQLRLEDAGTAQPVRTINSDRELAWAKGRLVLDNESIANAVAQFNRYNRVQLRVTDEKLAARPVSGIFDASDPESFIAFLQGVTSVQVKRTESEIVMQ